MPMNLIKKYLPTLAAFISMLSPMIAYAATNQDLKSIIATVADYLDLILKLLMGFAVLAFVWFVIRYFIMQADSENRAAAAQYVMWSLIGFFVILSLWGLVNILLTTFSLNDTNPSSLTNIQTLFPQ